MPIQFPAIIELNINGLPEKYSLDFNICPNPDCDCNGVLMAIYNKSNEIDIFFDFATESYSDNNYPENEATILKEFVSFLKSEQNASINLKFFKERYNYVKRGVRKKRDALNSFELGTFLLYRDILWHEGDLKMNFDGAAYLVIDGYCVSPGCSCTEAAISFIEDVYKLGVREPSFSFVYDYITEKVRDIKGMSEAKTKGIIPLISEYFGNQFKKRSARLKKAVKKDIAKKIEEKGLALNVPERRKLGRNEPCHCGSGIKYKKCCLDDDLKKYGRAIKVRYS